MFSRILRSIRNRIDGRLNPVNSLRGVYASFAEAQAAAPKSKPLGYDAGDTIEWYRHKHEGVSLEDYPVLYWLRAAFESSESVFEIGGHLGVAYYGFSRILAYPGNLAWTICDVPTVKSAGEALARERGRTNLHFVTAPSQCEGADIVMAAGSLQYVESPTLAEAIASFRRRPRHVIVNNSPVYDGPEFVTIQDIGSCFCPYRIFNREALVSSVGRLGYELVDSWSKPRTLRIPGHPARSLDHYSGFYWRSTRA